MPLGIYKPGQGYWVRVLTATFAGILLLAASAWLWGQLEETARFIPTSHYELTLRPAEGSAAVGDVVNLYRDPPPASAIGTATIRDVDALVTTVQLEIADVSMISGEWSALHVQHVAAGDASAATLSGQVVGRSAVPLFQVMFVQAAGVGLLLLIGAIVIFYYVGAKPGSAEFLIATDGEMKKVNWSTRRDVMGSTMIVIVWSFMIAAGLFVIDLAFSRFFQMVGVLE